MSPLIGRGRHYAMHVLLFAHEKQRCRPKIPQCPEFMLLVLCPPGRRRVRHPPPAKDVSVVPKRM